MQSSHTLETPDENEMLSLQLAMRLEAENQLLNQLSQMATLHMLYERPQRRQIHPDNPNDIDPDRMTYEVSLIV
ncbi:MAG TPA: hypothetical protein PLS50_09180, partial [Candidatus Dojkabacteria bacterium]|nr:hypothetical protein [Candidatus Dojkabacteria bacterium]